MFDIAIRVGMLSLSHCCEHLQEQIVFYLIFWSYTAILLHYGISCSINWILVLLDTEGKKQKLWWRTHEIVAHVSSWSLNGDRGGHGTLAPCLSDSPSYRRYGSLHTAKKSGKQTTAGARRYSTASKKQYSCRYLRRRQKIKAHSREPPILRLIRRHVLQTQLKNQVLGRIGQ